MVFIHQLNINTLAWAERPNIMEDRSELSEEVKCFKFNAVPLDRAVLYYYKIIKRTNSVVIHY